MLIRIRRRLAREDGISLIEMMISMFILSIGMLALLNSFTVSARAVLEQRMKAAATRVASEELETFRGQVWKPGFDPAAVPPEKTVNLDGRNYTVKTAVANSPTTPGLRNINTTVEWTVAGVLRTASSRTAVSSGVQAPAAVPTDAYITLEITPNPLRVWPNGSNWSPLVSVRVTANVIGAEYEGPITVRWRNVNEVVDRTETIVKSGGVWQRDIPGNSFVASVDANNGEGTLTLSASAPSAPTIPEVSYSLALLNYDDVALGLSAFNSPSNQTTSIRVYAPNLANGSCSGSNRCQNIEHAVFWLNNVDPEATSATLSWPSPIAGNPAETITLQRQTSGGLAGRVAGWVLSSAPRKFPIGTTSFTVTVYKGATAITTPLQFPLNVTVG